MLLRELETCNGPQRKPEELWSPPQSSWGSRALRASSVAAHELWLCRLAGWKQDKERNEASCTAGHIRDITTTTTMSCRTNTAASGN